MTIGLLCAKPPVQNVIRIAVTMPEGDFVKSGNHLTKTQ